MVGRTPYILVLGQDCPARYQLLNCLLGEKLLPLGSELGGTCGPGGRACKRRKLCLTHGRQKRLSLALPGQYELVHQLAANCSRWDTVPLQDLEIQDECEDPAHRLAELEIALHHSLLQVREQGIMRKCCTVTRREGSLLICAVTPPAFRYTLHFLFSPPHGHSLTAEFIHRSLNNQCVEERNFSAISSLKQWRVQTFTLSSTSVL